jgi:hypothetical protein
MKRVDQGQLRREEHEVWKIASGGSLVAVTSGVDTDVLIVRTYVPTSGTVDWHRFVGGGFQAIYQRVCSSGGQLGERLSATRGDEGPIYLVPIEIFAPPGADRRKIEEWVRNTEDEFLVGPAILVTEILPPETPGGYPIEGLSFRP